MLNSFKPYQWQARNSNESQLQTGIINAPNRQIAYTYLHAQGFIDIRLKPTNTNNSSKNATLKTPILSQFCKQLSTLLNAGIDLVSAINIISQNCNNKYLEKKYLNLKILIEQGNSFKQSLIDCQILNHQFYLQFIEVGEQSGNLEQMLAKLSTHLQNQLRLKRKLKSAMLYPLVVIASAIIIVSFLLLFIIPQFDSLFNSFEAELPFITRMLIDFAESLKQNTIIYGVTLTIIITIFHLFKKHHFLQPKIQACTLSLPIFGTLIKLYIITRFCHSLAILLTAGIPLSTCLDILSRTSEYHDYRIAICSLSRSIANGNSLTKSMQAQKLWPAELIAIVNTGESSGNLDHLLLHIAAEYDDKINQQIDNMGALVEPLLMLILGGIVAFIIIAMYLPVFQMGSIL